MPPATGAGIDDRQPVYYLVAPTGFPNYGDELIAAGWLRYLAEHAPEAEVWLDSHSPGPAAVMLSELHPRVRFTDTAWRLCWEAPSDEPWEVASWVRSAVANPGMAPRWAHGIELLRRAEVLHVLGGGIVNAVWPRHIGLLAAVVAAAEHSGGRSAMTGQGLLPTPESAVPLLRALVERFDFVDVRDQGTADLLGVEPGADDVFLDLGPHLYADDEAPKVMLCLQGDLVQDGLAHLAGAVLAMLTAWKVEPHEVCIVEAIPRVDREIYTLLEHELPGACFMPFTELWQRGLPVSAEQTWISTRFHPHLLAAAGGASGVALSVHADYYAVKHQSLTAFGSGWSVVDDLAAVVRGDVPERPAGGGMDETVVSILGDSKRALARSIYAPVVHTEQ